MHSQSAPQNRPSADPAALLVVSRAPLAAPVGGDPARVTDWFDAAGACARIAPPGAACDLGDFYHDPGYFIAIQGAGQVLGIARFYGRE
jgi:hypothetical protein